MKSKTSRILQDQTSQIPFKELDDLIIEIYYLCPEQIQEAERVLSTYPQSMEGRRFIVQAVKSRKEVLFPTKPQLRWDEILQTIPKKQQQQKQYDRFSPFSGLLSFFKRKISSLSSHQQQQQEQQSSSPCIQSCQSEVSLAAEGIQESKYIRLNKRSNDYF